LGGAAAGHLHGLLDQPPRTLLIWTVGADQRRSREPWRFRRTSNQLRWPGGQLPPVISIEDTVLDLCAGRQVREVVELVTRAVQHRLTRPEYLLRRMHERGRVGHRRLISDLLAEVEDGAETPLELAYLIEVERAHGLPTGRRQRRERVSGHHRDVWYEQWRTVVELDGRLGHEGVGRFRDMALDNVAALRAETTLRYGWHDVRGRPCDVAREVGQVLRRAGWPGSLAECRRCRGRVCPSV
jgi:hypothetical protein